MPGALAGKSRHGLSGPLLFWGLLFAAMAAARLCHSGVLWAEETLHMAAGAQIAHGAVLFRDIWFDKPPLMALFYAPLTHGWALRLVGAVYTLAACALAWGFARDLWGRREAYWAAGLMAFFLTFYLPSAVIPLASDLLTLAPHLAAVWLAWRGRTFWGGAAAGLAFLFNPKAVFVLAACAAWRWRGLPGLALGFAAVNAAAVVWLWSQGALGAYWDQVWRWGFLYAGDTFVDEPALHAAARTLAWAGFHAAPILAAAWAWPGEKQRWHWLAWAAISMAAAAMGWRFFPRYFFQVLPVVVLLGARGFVLMGSRRRLALALLMFVPLVRFGPRYPLLAAGRSEGWRDIAMDRDSRAASELVRGMARPGDTLFVWGFRPEMFVYTGLKASSRFIDSQPLTGVPADRHLVQSESLAPEAGAANRRELARSRPEFVIDGLGPYNPRLAITGYPDLEEWLAGYTPVGRTGGTVVYRRK
jgi:hypothetical protein